MFNYSVPKSVDNSVPLSRSHSIRIAGDEKNCILVVYCFWSYLRGLTNLCWFVTSLLWINTKHSRRIRTGLEPVCYLQLFCCLIVWQSDLYKTCKSNTHLITMRLPIPPPDHKRHFSNLGLWPFSFWYMICSTIFEKCILKNKIVYYTTFNNSVCTHMYYSLYKIDFSIINELSYFLY